MKRVDLLPILILKAQGSSFWLAVLNFLLARTIPFNRPHGFRIQTISKQRMQIFGPYRRANHNHIRGIHACAIATAAEFSAGFLLLTNLDPSRFRLIMAKLEADYSYQAKEDIVAESLLPEERLQSEVVLPLRERDLTTILMTTEVRDVSGNMVAAIETTWQVKRWDKVRTKV